MEVIALEKARATAAAHRVVRRLAQARRSVGDFGLPSVVGSAHSMPNRIWRIIVVQRLLETIRIVGDGEVVAR